MINPVALACAAICLGGSVALAAEGQLEVYANGESLATQGFVAPQLTRDGWELRFDSILVTVADIALMQTDPPYDAGTGGNARATVTVPLQDGGPIALDLTMADDDDRVPVGTVAAPAGHYNAVSWSIAPAASGPHAGYSMVLTGTATREGESLPFTILGQGRHDYVCGEYVGDQRKGILADGGTADLELTFHLDHIFGRADRAADDPMNLAALPSDSFTSGAPSVIDLGGLHIGHVGEGHCAIVAD